MMTFLKIVAAFLAAIVIFVILVIAFIRWKFRSLLKNLVESAAAAANSAVPPFRISLKSWNDDEDDEDSEWVHDDDMQRLTAEFEEAGFTQLGDFDAEGLPLQLRGFQHQEHHVYGVIYDHATVGCWCDVVRRYADETAWTVSSGKKHGMDAPPYHHPNFLPGQPVSELLETLLKTSPRDGIQKAGADMFVPRFEAAYTREMNWRIERRGPTEEEIRRIAALNEQECTPELVEQIQNQWRTAIAEFLSERAIKAWRKESGISTREFDRLDGSLFAIHDRMLPEQLAEFAYDHFPEDFDDDSDTDDAEGTDSNAAKLLAELKQWCQQESPIRAFRKLLNSKGADAKWKLLGEIRKPVKSEIWQRLDASEQDGSDEDVSTEDDDDLSL